MIRILNFAFLAVAGVTCLGLYHVAERARVADADLRATRAEIASEHDALAVLGAEWASLTQPARIQALAERQLNLADRPTVALSSLTSLPNRNAAVAPDSPFRAAKATVPAPAPSNPTTTNSHTGT
jgi:hypothetical protein